MYLSFQDNIWGADLADMQSISKYNKGVRFLLCFTDIYTKHILVVPLENKKSIAINKVFQATLYEADRKLNKIS